MRDVLPAVVALLAAGCGRTLVYDCHLEVSPSALDFGKVEVGASTTLWLTLSSVENGGCDVSGLAFGAGSDPGFSLPPEQLTAFIVPPGQAISVAVTFETNTAAPSLRRTGTLAFGTGDSFLPNASVPLTVEVPQCILTVAPPTLDFGLVDLGVPSGLQATVENVGSLTCDVSSLALAPGSDPGFSLPNPAPFMVPPDAGATILVDFEESVSALPLARTGVLTFDTGSPTNPDAGVALLAEIPRCVLGISPTAVNFGNVPLNGSRSGQVTLTNDGGVTCDVTQIALAPTSDVDFSIPAGQATSLTVAPGGSATIAVGFDDLGGATPPLTHTGTLDFETGDFLNPSAVVPLTAFIDTACTDGGQWIYTIDSNGTLSAFHPDTLTFDDIGLINCPDPNPNSSPFSMGVDQTGTAWVLYEESDDATGDGNLFQVSTVTAACQATTYVPGQLGFWAFGMGFVFSPTANTDTLYVGNDMISELGTISFPSLTVSELAPLTLTQPEFTGTGDGELWTFSPLSSPPVMEQIDPTTGDMLTTYDVPEIPAFSASGVAQDWAVGFYGGAFWAFFSSAGTGGSTSVYEIQRSDGTVTVPLTNTGRHIVGAGVSTCAPLE